MKKTIVAVVACLMLLVGCKPYAPPGTVTDKGHVGNCWWIKIVHGEASSKPCVPLAKWRKIRVGDRWEGK